MPKVTCRLSISYDESNKLRPLADGIFAASLEDVESFGKIVGSEVSVTESKVMGINALLKVCLPEDSPELLNLIAAIESKYGFKLFDRLCIPLDLRESHYALVKDRVFSKKEIDSSPLLWLRGSRAIAKHDERTLEQAENDVYVAERQKPRSGLRLGFLTPFTGMAVNDALKEKLLGADIAALDLSERVVNTGDLWSLRSKTTLPACWTKVFNSWGELVTDCKRDWVKFEGRGYKMDYDPPALRFGADELASVGDFDIAMTRERIEGGVHSAYRQCIVTQRFRQVLKELKVSGVEYVPVEVV